MLTGADHSAVAAGSGQVAPGHPTGGGDAALVDREPGTAQVPATLRQLAHHHLRRFPRCSRRSPGGRGAGRRVPSLDRRPQQPADPGDRPPAPRQARPPPPSQRRHPRGGRAFRIRRRQSGADPDHLRELTLAAGHRDTRRRLASSGLPHPPHVHPERTALHRRPRPRANPRRAAAPRAWPATSR